MNAFDARQWGVIIKGPDSIFACKSFEHAVEKCEELNDIAADLIKPLCSSESHPIVWAQIDVWENLSDGPHDPDETDWDEPFSG